MKRLVRKMEYHDWHLSGYSVTDFGQNIILHLAWNYPDSDYRENHIEFSDVAAYHFLHTDGTILTVLKEFHVSSFIDDHEDYFKTTAQQQGLRYWDGDFTKYKQHIVGQNYKSWGILSAIGFEGFIMAKSVQEIKKPNEGLDDDPKGVSA